MSKADTLGPPPAFGAPRSARGAAIAKRLGGEATAESVSELPLTVISDNPDNPRDHLRNLDETVQSVREVGVLLPIVVATADAYLSPRPGRAGDLEQGAQYVVIDGHRRLEAARRVGLATIPVRVDNARVATDEALLEAAFVANYHRDDMTDLEEATALQALVEFYGSQTKAAKRLGIAQSAISSKLSLLKLAPDLQADLISGKRTVEHVRNLGKLTPEEQRSKADERAAAAAAKRAVQPPAPEAKPAPATPVERASGPADYHGVIITDRPAETPPEPVSAREPAAPASSPREQDARPATPQSVQVVPEPRPAPEVKKFPYDNPGEAALLLAHKMDGADLLEVWQRLGAHLGRADREARDKVAQALLDDPSQ